MNPALPSGESISPELYPHLEWHDVYVWRSHGSLRARSFPARAADVTPSPHAVNNQTERLKWLSGRGFDEVKVEVDPRIGAVNLLMVSWLKGFISRVVIRFGGFPTDLGQGSVWYVPPTLFSIMRDRLCVQAGLILDGAVTAANIRSLAPWMKINCLGLIHDIRQPLSHGVCSVCQCGPHNLRHSDARPLRPSEV